MSTPPDAERPSMSNYHCVTYTLITTTHLTCRLVRRYKKKTNNQGTAFKNRLQILIVLRFHARNQICFQIMIKYYNILEKK